MTLLRAARAKPRWPSWIIARMGPLTAVLMPTMLLPAGPALADTTTATATGIVAATLVRPIMVRETADLDFGVVTNVPASGESIAGTMTITAMGVPTYSAGVREVCDGAWCFAPHPAAFHVDGDADASYTITTPATLTITGVQEDGTPAPSLSVVALAVATTSRPAEGGKGRLGADGQDSFTIGGTLALPASPVQARYRATLSVAVAYD